VAEPSSVQSPASRSPMETLTIRSSIPSCMGFLELLSGVFPNTNVVSLLSLGPLRRFYMSLPSVVYSSRAFALLTFLLLNSPCLISYEYVGLAVQGQRFVTFVLEQSPNYSGTNSFPGSASASAGGAVQPSVDHNIGPPLTRYCPRWLLPYGVPAAPRRPPLILKCPPNLRPLFCPRSRT
jgi:hypothetical protein